YFIFQKLNRFYIGFSEGFDQRLDFHRDKAQNRKFTYNADDWEVYLKHHKFIQRIVISSILEAAFIVLLVVYLIRRYKNQILRKESLLKEKNEIVSKKEQEKNVFQ